METKKLLNTRHETHGEYSAQAKTTQYLKAALKHGASNWNTLSSEQKEALEMICVKLGRIVNGDPNYADHWDDIAGYAELGKFSRPERASK